MPSATAASAARAFHASSTIITPETNSCELDIKRRIVPTQCEVPLRALHEQCVARAQAQASIEMARRHALALVRSRRDQRKRAARAELALLDRAIHENGLLAAATASNSSDSDATLSDMLSERSTNGSDQGSDLNDFIVQDDDSGLRDGARRGGGHHRIAFHGMCPDDRFA